MINIVLLIASASVIVIIAVCEPQYLADNLFLNAFVTHEALALLAVVLTVNLASVANIHLSINRIVKDRFAQLPDAAKVANEIKDELRQNCWFLFAGFVASFFLLVWKGSSPQSQIVYAAVHGSMIWIFLLYLAVMYDVYRVVFGFAKLDEASGVGGTL